MGLAGWEERSARANPSHKALRPSPSVKLRASMMDFLALLLVYQLNCVALGRFCGERVTGEKEVKS